jgi:uncharacterized protein (TIGR00730 family)
MTTEPNRVELDPTLTTTPQGEGMIPERPAHKRADSPEIALQLDALITSVGGTPSTMNGKLVKDLLTAGLKLIPDGRDTGELKLITAAVKELRYAYNIFGQYAAPHKVTIFGSARTPPDHPDYAAARDFGRLMAEAGWMAITGAGDGIMKAGHEGPGREASFGVAIRLPFETSANTVIAGDEKLINFRYFFTRKLMFLSQAEAVACFPGGFGTMDEAYETLTLVQTGKASMIPIVLVEGAGPGNDYWPSFLRFTRETLLAKKFISPEDENLYYLAKDPADAVAHILKFYRNYHSSRYVRDTLVIRLHHRLKDADVARLATEFASLIKSGTIEQRGPLEQEDDHRDLPRLCFTHTRYHYGMIRKLIDRINECDPAT